jgi:hypothetical protein
MRLLSFRKHMGASRKAPIERESGLQSSSALNQINNQYDDGNYEQEMDQTAANADSNNMTATTRISI